MTTTVSHPDVKSIMNRSSEGSSKQVSIPEPETPLKKASTHEQQAKQHGQEAITTASSQTNTLAEMEKLGPDNWVKRNPELIRLTGPHPFNAETPMSKLMAEGLITPNALHYVRNHGVVPKLDWSTHKVTVEGLVKNPKAFSMDELVAMPSISVAVTFACDGNRRKEINMIKRSAAFGWGSGGVGTAVWKGVPLYHVLNACGVQADKGKYLHLEGSETLANGKYATSIPLATAMDPMSDTMLAYEMNGERLPPDHGFPVRVILPGFVGGRMVKWLAKLSVSEEESTNFYHLHDNKVMPPGVDLDTPRHAPIWKDPSYALYELNINSVIASPFNEQFLHFDHISHTDTIKVTGYAFSGGGRRINRVDFSLNNGKSWSQAELKFPENGFRHNGTKCFAWCHWNLDVPVWKLLTATEMVVRAFDTSFNTQPENPTWSALGMLNNAWYRVKVDVKAGGNNDTIVVFRHPVEPGFHAGGGWMTPKSKHLREDAAIKPVLSLPWADVAAARAGKLISMDEVAEHNKEEDCWIVVDRQVIDVSSYMHEHPGGKAPILLFGGRDVSSVFHDIHATDAYEILTRYMIGTISKDKHLIAESAERKRAINPRHWISAKLIEKKQLTHDTYRFRFELPGKQMMGLPVGQHVLIGSRTESKFLVRPYTPIRPIGDVDDDGTFDIVFKLYKLGEMSNVFSKLEIGDSVLVKGPAGHIIYQGNGIVHVTPDSYKVNQISMIAGGTGITPMYQLIQAIVKENSNVKLSLLYANNSVEDIILRDELDALAKEHPDRLTIWYTVGVKPKTEWKYSVGRIDERMTREHLFLPSEETIVFLCGPPAMLSRAAYPDLFNIGYTEESFEF